jgi:hypothetical protein
MKNNPISGHAFDVAKTKEVQYGNKQATIAAFAHRVRLPLPRGVIPQCGHILE